MLSSSVSRPGGNKGLQKYSPAMAFNLKGKDNSCRRQIPPNTLPKEKNKRLRKLEAVNCTRDHSWFLVLWEDTRFPVLSVLSGFILESVCVMCHKPTHCSWYCQRLMVLLWKYTKCLITINHCYKRTEIQELSLVQAGCHKLVLLSKASTVLGTV